MERGDLKSLGADDENRFPQKWTWTGADDRWSWPSHSGSPEAWYLDI